MGGGKTSSACWWPARGWRAPGPRTHLGKLGEGPVGEHGRAPAWPRQQSLCWAAEVGGAGGPQRRSSLPPQLTRPPSPSAGPGQELALTAQGVHGRGEAWRMYWVHWNTRKARLARKSRADSRRPTGRSWKPVRSAGAGAGGQGGGWGVGAEERGPAALPAPGAPRAAHPSGSGRPSSAAGFGPAVPAERSSSSKASRCRGRRGWGTGLAWSRPPSCGPGAQAGACSPPPAPSSAPTRGALLCPLQAPAVSRCRPLSGP